MLNYKVNSKSNYSSITSDEKRDISSLMVADKFINNNIYSQYPYYINPINYVYNPDPNPQYPSYFTNYNTSNNYHINASQQNLFYENNNPKYNRYIYHEDNNIKKNYYENYINKTVNRKLINEAKENIRSVSHDNKKKKKINNNYVKLDIINCETQYPIMTCLNSDPYNKFKRKSFIQSYNYRISSSSKNNSENIENTKEENLSSIKSENIFKDIIRFNNKNEFNNSCYNFRKKRNIKNIEIVNYNLKKNNNLVDANVHNNFNKNKKSKLKEVILNTDYNDEDNLPNINQKINNKNNDSILANRFKNDYEEKQNLENKLKKFINLIELYFINSFHKLFLNFLSQMVVFIQAKIYPNKNLLLKRFQRARNHRMTQNRSYNYTPDKMRKYESCNNSGNNSKIYIPKKQYKYVKPTKMKLHNLNEISFHKNSNRKKLPHLNTDNHFKVNEIPFQKKVIHRNNNSVDKLRNKGMNIYNKNRSQDNLLVWKKFLPNTPALPETKFILKKNLNNFSNNKGLIYTKKTTNKFNIFKKYIKDEFFNNNINIYNNALNNKNNSFSFINFYGNKSPIINKFKENERYDYEYNEKENDDNEEIIEETIIKDICTYDNKFSVFIKYVTSQRYEQNYLRLKILKHQNLYLNHKLEYIDRIHTDSIILPATFYRNSNMMMNEISEEKESFNLSNIQEDENDLNKLLNMFNIIEYFYKQKLIYFYHQFFNSLKYIFNYSSNKKDSKGRNNSEEKILKSKTYLNLKNKNFLIENNKELKKKLVDINFVNDIFKRSNSVKIMNKENNIINNSDMSEKSLSYKNKIKDNFSFEN